MQGNPSTSNRAKCGARRPWLPSTIRELWFANCGSLLAVRCWRFVACGSLPTVRRAFFSNGGWHR
jgi:hypothetical protein